MCAQVHTFNGFPALKSQVPSPIIVNRMATTREDGNFSSATGSDAVRIKRHWGASTDPDCHHDGAGLQDKSAVVGIVC